MWSLGRRSFNWKDIVLVIGSLAAVFTIYSYSMTAVTSDTQTWQMVKKLFRNDDALYLQRRETLLEACNGNVIEYKGKADSSHRLAVDDKHQLIYCPIAKVSSTFWKRVMQVSSGVKTGLNPFDVSSAHDKSLITLKYYPFNIAYRMLNKYTSFMFAREPYSRLLACYIDKFFTTNLMFWKIGRTIIKNHRQNPTPLALSCGHDVTFAEFIKHVIDTVEKNPATANDHWKPMYVVCSPCEIEYDIIGHLETISQDLDYILERYMKGDIIFDNMENESETDRLVKNTKGLFSRYTPVAQKCMSLPETLLRLLRKEQIRGIINKSVELPEWLNRETNVSKADVLKFILDKYKEDSDNTQRKLNRKEALIEAYSQIPLEDMIKLQQLYKPDFHIFGYDPQPAELFTDEPVKKFYFPF